MRILLYCIFSISILACKSEEKKVMENSAETTAESQPVTEFVENRLTPIGKGIFDTLYNNTTFIDYLWHDLPFSVSQADPAAVKANVTFISPNGLSKLPKHCKSIGRKSYQFNGDIFMDADIYFGDGCAYYIFIQDNKRMWLNQISEDGQKFYTHLIQSGLEQRQKAIEQASQGSN